MLANGCSGCLVGGWVLIWTGIVLVFDTVVAVTAYHQLRALTFPTAEGVVTRCEVTSVDDTDGPTSKLDLAYEYEVNGRRHAGTRYSYTEISTNTQAWQRVAARMPRGAPVRVSYDPADPAESLLRPGLTGFHLSMLWFVTPFNLVMVGGWVCLVRSRRSAADPLAPRAIVPTATGWRVRLSGFGRAGWFAVTFLAITFFGTFVWALGCGFNPAVPLAGWGYVAALAVAALVAARLTPQCLEVDEVARVLRLPAKPAPLEIPFDAVRGVTVTRETYKDSEGDVVERYHCRLLRKGPPPVNVATYSCPAEAEALAAWLRGRIWMKPPSPPA